MKENDDEQDHQFHSNINLEEDHDESDFLIIQENILDSEPPPDVDDGNDEDLGGFAPAFNPEEYESQEMKRLIAMHAPDEILPPGLENIGYTSSDIFPDWILQNSLWKNAPKKVESNEISEILNVPVSKRTQEQSSTLIHWLMSVWQTANQMGFKRCGSMFKEFNYNVFQPGENIITEGERGLTFYIIISGNTVVSKDGIGVVGQLGKGKSFGEIALTQGKDLRTATVTAQTRVEVLSLHKQNYDIFVRDILEMERRENFQLLASCSLFKNWAKGKIEKMCNTCTRKSYEDGQYIFRQGDPPGDLMIIVEGNISIFKELVIVTKNRWPVGLREWKERVRRTTKPIMLKTLSRGEYFGEIAILKNIPRSTSAIAQGRCVLLCIDKAEFLFLLNLSTLPIKLLKDEQAVLTANLAKYYDDMQVMETVQHIKGGPQSVAYVGQLRAGKAKIDEKMIKEYARDSEEIEIMKPSTDPAGISITDDNSNNENADRRKSKKKVLISYPKHRQSNNNKHNRSSAGHRPSSSSATLAESYSAGENAANKRPGTTGSIRSSHNSSNNINNNNNSNNEGFVANVDPVYLNIMRRQSVAEQIRTAVMESKVRKQRSLENRNLDYAKIFDKQGHSSSSPTGASHNKQHFIGTSAAATHLIHSQMTLPSNSNLVPNPTKAHLRLQSQEIIREKLQVHHAQRRGSIAFHAAAAHNNAANNSFVRESSQHYHHQNHHKIAATNKNQNQNGVDFSAAAAAAAAAVGLNISSNNNSSFVCASPGKMTRSSMAGTPAHMRRVSLQGLDNDANTTYAYDTNKVVMRRNSVIRLGQVYEHVYQRIQLEAAAESAASAAAAAMFGSAGYATTSPLQRTAPIDIFNLSNLKSPSSANLNSNMNNNNNSPQRKRSMSPTRINSLSRQNSSLLNKNTNTTNGRLGTLMRGMSNRGRGKDSFNNSFQEDNIDNDNNNGLFHRSVGDDSSGGGVIVGRVPFAANNFSNNNANINTFDNSNDNNEVKIRRPTRKASVGVFEPYKEATVPILQEVLSSPNMLLSSNNIMNNTHSNSLPALTSQPSLRLGSEQGKSLSFKQ